MDDFDLDQSTNAAPSLNLQPDEWKRFTGSTDSKGHGKQIWVQFTPEEVARMATLIPLIAEYKTIQDIVRNHVRWGMRIDSELLKDANPVASAESEMAFRRMSVRMRMEHERAIIAEDEDSVRQIAKLMERPPTLLRIKIVKDVLSEMMDSTERATLYKSLHDWAGEMLHDDGE